MFLAGCEVDGKGGISLHSARHTLVKPQIKGQPGNATGNMTPVLAALTDHPQFRDEEKSTLL